MEKTQKYIASDNESGFYVIKEKKLFKSAPFFCPVCNFSLSRQEDFIYYSTYSCCLECGTKFAEAQREKWIDGKRPTREEIKEHILEIEMKTRDIFLLDTDT